MAETSGNLALKRDLVAALPKPRRTAAPVRAKRPVIKTRRIPVAATPGHEAVQHAKAKAIRQSLAIQRLRMLLGAICTILIIAGVFTLVVYRQATILEMNFNNLAIERQIARIEQERSQISEELAQKTNLDLIRQQAIDRLGLQDPAGSQLVRVDIPASDRIIFAMPNSVNSDNDAYLASVYQTVEGYFKSMNQQRKGR